MIRQLGPGDLAIIRSLLNGNTRVKEIAWDVQRTHGGVKTSLCRIYIKLGVRDLPGLALWAAGNRHLV